MGVAIGDPHAIPSVDRNPRRVEDFARAIRSDESSIRFVDDYRRWPSTAKDIHPSGRLHGDLADAGWREIGRRPAKVTLYSVSPSPQGHIPEFSGHLASSRYAAN